jgi:hypothetical protein
MYVQEARTPLAVGCCVAGTRARAYAFVEAYKKGLADDTRPESIATFCSATTTLVIGTVRTVRTRRSISAQGTLWTGFNIMCFIICFFYMPAKVMLCNIIAKSVRVSFGSIGLSSSLVWNQYVWCTLKL